MKKSQRKRIPGVIFGIVLGVIILFNFIAIDIMALPAAAYRWKQNGTTQNYVLGNGTSYDQSDYQCADGTAAECSTQWDWQIRRVYYNSSGDVVGNYIGPVIP